MDYKGTIIEESLENKDVLKDFRILDTKIEEVTEKHQTPWLRQWTLHLVEIPESNAQKLAEKISWNLDYSHKNAWYADYKNPEFHYIIFKDKIFKIGRSDAGGYEAAKRHGTDLGIPEYQLDFSPDIE